MEQILIKNGELSLKGLNRSSFEITLAKNVKRAVSPFGDFKVTRSQSTIIVEPVSADCDFEAAANRIAKVFGIAAFTRAVTCEKNLEDIAKTAISYMAPSLENVRTFKIEAKRADKRFPLTSPEICREIGAAVLDAFSHLSVDVHHPDVTVWVEIRDRFAFIHGDQQKGAGGLPLGTTGRAILLLSGGIDSPVAGYLMAKRGIGVTAIHFESPPYTSERARKKVLMLAKKLCDYCGWIRVLIVPFTEIQEQLRGQCSEELFTVLMRRAMMRISSMAAEKKDCLALITGESVGQVASQTMSAIVCTDAAASVPVYRPLIGLDKSEIIEIARHIDTFEISSLPYEDCCTVFTPRHPKTHPQLCRVLEEEEKIPFLEKMLQEAFEGITEIVVNESELSE